MKKTEVSIVEIRADYKGSVEGYPDKAGSETFKGTVTELSKNPETNMPEATVRLSGGETQKVSGGLLEGVKAGDYVRFSLESASTESGSAPLKELSVIRHSENAENAPKAAQSKQNMMKTALLSAGLKVNGENLKLVSALFDKGLPLSKEAVLTLSRAVKMVGAENLARPLFLMSNGITPTAQALETLSRHQAGDLRLSEQIQKFAENIVKMNVDNTADNTVNNSVDNNSDNNSDNGGAGSLNKQALIKIFSGGDTAQRPQNAQNPRPPSDIQAAISSGGAFAGEVSSEGVLYEGGAAHGGTRDAQAVNTSGSAQNTAQIQSGSPPYPFSDRAFDLKALTDYLTSFAEQTEFFRSVFNVGEDAAGQPQNTQNAQNAQNSQNAQQNTAETFLQSAALNFENGAAAELKTLLQNGGGREEIERATLKLLKEILPSGGSLPLDTQNTAEMKSFLQAFAKRAGIFSEAVEKTQKLEQELIKNIERGAKKIAERLSLSLDNKADADEIKRELSDIKETLIKAASALPDSGEAQRARQSLAEIKDNLQFLNNLKNTPVVHFPIVINGKNEQAELYVFSRKGRKNNGKRTHSAVLALSSANLGRVEAYVQKTDNAVSCQFRLESAETEQLIRDNLEGLYNALKNKSLNLNFTSFKKIGERFTITSEEPDISDGAEASQKSENDGGLTRFSFDCKL